MEDHETLETGTVIGEFSDSIKSKIDDFFTDGIVTSSEVVSGIFFTRDKLFWVE